MRDATPRGGKRKETGKTDSVLRRRRVIMYEESSQASGGKKED